MVGLPSSQSPKQLLIPSRPDSSLGFTHSNLVIPSNLFSPVFHLDTNWWFSLESAMGYTTMSPRSAPLPSALTAPQSSCHKSSMTNALTGFQGEFYKASSHGKEAMEPHSWREV